MKTIVCVIAVLVLSAVFLGGCQSLGTTKAGDSPVLSGYKSMRAPNGGLRYKAHEGIDFGGAYGDPIIAAANGYVTRALPSRSSRCGYSVIIYHPDVKPARYTKYCHMSEILVRSGENVKRGKVIGYVGTTGSSGDITHVHFVVFRRDESSSANSGNQITENPMLYLEGCYDPNVIYPKDKLVLTSPLLCD